MLSIIIPVLNNLNYTKQILKEIDDNTKSKYELIIIDSLSDDWTQEYFDNHSIEDWISDITTLRYIRCWDNKRVNGAWNYWVELAQWEHIAILNNDLLLSEWRDEKLIKWLDEYKLTYPSYTCWDKTDWKIMYENRFWENICWRCFVMKKSDWKPIPEDIKIWFWDNYIDIYLNHNHWCVKDCKIHHFESKTITNEDFIAEVNERILEDKQNWFKIKNNIWN